MGLIASLRESMFWWNQSSRSASSPNIEVKFAFLSSHVRRPGKAFIHQFGIWYLCLWAKIYIKFGNRIKIGTSEAICVPKCRIKHHLFRHCRSRFFTSGGNRQCTLYCTLYVNFATHNAKSVRYYTVLCAWYRMQECLYDTIPCCVHDIACKSVCTMLYSAVCMISHARVLSPRTATIGL